VGTAIANLVGAGVSVGIAGAGAVHAEMVESTNRKNSLKRIVNLNGNETD
jgi:hypothetical protein